MLSASSASGCFPSLSSLGMCKCLCMRVCVCKCPLCLRIWMENPHIWQQSPLRFCTTRLLRFHSRVEGVFSSLLGLSLILSILHLAALFSLLPHIRYTHTHCYSLLHLPYPNALSLFFILSLQHTCFQPVIWAAMVLQHSQLRKCLHMHTPTQQKEEREKPLAWRHWQQRIKEMAVTWKSEECIGENGHRMDAGNLDFTLMRCYL